MKSQLNKLYQRYRYSLILLKELSKTDFVLRYEGSVLGYLWSLLKPFALFLVLYVVFGRLLPLNKGIENFTQYLILGIVLWNFFVEVTKNSTTAIVSRSGLIRKINFPKYVIILSTSVSATINLFLSLGVVMIFMVFGGIEFSFSMLGILPVIVELFILSTAIGLILSTLYVKFRDVNFIWDVVVQGLFYATPIVYSLQVVQPVKFQKIIMLSPMSQIIQDARHFMLGSSEYTVFGVFEQWYYRAIPYTIVVVLSIVGVLYFRKNSPNFAEEV